MISPVVPAAAGIFRWKILDSSLRYFCLFMVLSVIHVVIEYVVGSLNISTHFLSDIFRSIEVVCFILLFHNYQKPKYKSVLSIVLILLYLITWIYIMVFNNISNQFNTVMAILARIILIFAAMTALFNLVVNSKVHLAPLYSYYIFWIALGVLLYCSGTFMVLSLGNEIMKYGKEYFMMMWSINWSFYIISNICFTVSFYHLKQ